MRVGVRVMVGGGARVGVRVTVGIKVAVGVTEFAQLACLGEPLMGFPFASNPFRTTPMLVIHENSPSV